MKMWTVWLPLLFVPFEGAWAINKCTNKDGTVSFQDAPCPREAETRQLEIKVGPKPAPPAPALRPGTPLPPLPSADSSDPRASRAATAATDLEALAVRGRDCRNQLAFGGSDRADVCQRWAMDAQAQLKPALAVLQELSNDAEFRNRHRSYFDRGFNAARTMDNDALAIMEMVEQAKRTRKLTGGLRG